VAAIFQVEERKIMIITTSSDTHVADALAKPLVNR
jgi:hypothetical protein